LKRKKEDARRFTRSAFDTTPLDLDLDLDYLVQVKVGIMADIKATPSPEGSFLNAPALPARSAMRSSKLFDSLAVKNALADQQPPLSPAAAPHDVYLSSEEDASSSADDFSDYEFSSESESQGSPALGPQQATARVVSVIFHGKPSLVNLSPRSTSPTSSISTSASTSTQTQQLQHAPSRSLHRTSTVSDLDHKRSSIASTASSNFFNFSRSSTMTLGSYSTNKPSFLSIDPFASKSTSNDADELDRPRTPTAILKRKLSLSKKRSKPALNNERASQVRESVASRPVSFVHVEAEGRMHERRPSTPQPSVNYQDIMRAARRTAQSTPPPPPTPPPAQESKPSAMGGGKRSRLRNLSISRKLSVKP
jgi:hypothetical protein